MNDNMKVDSLGKYELFYYENLSNSSDSYLICPSVDSTYFFIYLEELNQIKLDTVNLDSANEVELILQAKGCNYGSGGGSCDAYFMILNTDSIPTFLFNEHYLCAFEGFSRSYGNDEERTPYTYEITERKIRIEERSIIVEEVISEATENGVEVTAYSDCGLTQIPNGRYRMVEGKVKFIEK